MHLIQPILSRPYSSIHATNKPLNRPRRPKFAHKKNVETHCTVDRFSKKGAMRNLEHLITGIGVLNLFLLIFIR